MSSNNYYELYYHIIWTTKHRYHLITAFEEKHASAAISIKISKLGGKLLACNMVSDHCHLLVTIPPQVSISEFVGQVKGYSAHELNQIKGERYFEWQGGFGVLSLSKKGVPFVNRYIKNQKVHHADNTTLKVLEVSADDGQDTRP